VRFKANGHVDMNRYLWEPSLFDETDHMEP